MKISVIMPAYNTASTIGTQLEALTQQEWQFDWELIVADNGSTDQTLSIIKSYVNCFPQLWIVYAIERRGATFARNTAASVAAGDAFIFCDADDVAAPDWLRTIATVLEAYDLVIGHMEMSKLNSRSPVPDMVHPEQKEIEHGRAKFEPYLYYVTGAGFGIRRSYHEIIGGFDENLMASEDVDYGFKAQLAGARVFFADQAVMHYHLRPNLSSSFQQGVFYSKSIVPHFSGVSE